MNAPTGPIRLPSIGSRLGVAMALILALAAIVTIAAAYQFGRSAADTAFDRLLKGAAVQIAERVTVIDGAPVVDVPPSAFELLSLARNDRFFYRVTGPGGETLTGYDDLVLPEVGGNEAAFNVTYRGVDLRAFVLRRQLAERSVTGDVTVMVAQTTGERVALARSIAAQALTIILVTGLTLLALALIVLRVALRPLSRIEDAILARDANDLSPLNVRAPREVAALVMAINRFMGRLDRRVRVMQDFVTDAAHQLRTPITAMSAQAQLALSEKDPRKLDRLHQRIHRRSVGLGRLADQLLSHAMVTHRAETEQFGVVDLRRVAMDAERDFGNLADGPPEIALDLPDDPVAVRGDQVSLREAVRNLLDNAVRHGSVPVAVRVATENDSARIIVRDRGAGMPDDVLDKVGERFLASGIGPESAGLGLSIVAAVASAHDGALRAQRCPEGGFEISLDLPRIAS